MGLVSKRKRLHRNPVEWAEKQYARGKFVMSAIALLWFMNLVYYDVNKIKIAAELVRIVGLGCLVHKIGTEESCGGLSFKSQMITAMSLFARLYCSSVMQQDVYVFMDFMTLVVTLWVLCKLQFRLRSTYSKDLDQFPLLYLLGPCVLLSIISYPKTGYPVLHRMLWAFGVYLETVQIIPQLNLMQSIRVIEPHTAHYVFALGVSNLLNCIHFVIRMVEGNKHLFKIIGPGTWAGVTLVSKLLSFLMLGDFSFYYIKRGGNFSGASF
uniref:ER lumen protein-retaining receptor n=1 Tax=Physcomitrium patens TaxID=3218 RepID=A0A2K1L296_PHYPA|nr:hypothetical protein PHYPA_002940 [Physcomitrium patens]